MTKRIGLILTAVTVALSIFIVIFRADNSGLGQGPSIRRVQAPLEDNEYLADAGSLRTLYRTINLLQKNYIDASRINPREMLVEAMRTVQLHVSKVLVRESEDNLTVSLGAKERSFALGDVSTPWILLQRAKEIFAFVQSDMDDGEDFKEVEYAAINGMLHTLDPHTALLPPDIYRDMKDKTQGEFGGLGIVISIRDGSLTVISPIDGTPAYQAGVKAGDKIVKIGEASTVSMPLNDAVNLMRGKPGTSVTLWIVRKGSEDPRPFNIVRAIIQVRSVESEMLSGKIGYVRIKDFQGNTASDLRKHLSDLSKDGIRGLVLDLRNNPGGLLTAAIEISDVFLKSGVIVTTAGQNPSDRDIRRANNLGDEPSYPVVVLVNSGSASASEIVAGALKNHNRALLVGERTFGKGSVQVLYDYQDGSALKMTTAQYLTPGDISIQSVGVVPHVELLPMRADQEMLDLKVEAGYRESDLNHHFTKDSPSLQIIRPEQSLKYLWTPKKQDKKTENPKDDQDTVEEPIEPDNQPFEPDFEITLARDLAVQMVSLGMKEVRVDQLSNVLQQKSGKEQSRLVSSLKKIGVDWSLNQSEYPFELSVDAKILGAAPLTAGETRKLEVTVSNQGSGPVYRLMATTRSDFTRLDDKELAFGRVDPGKSISKILEFKIPKDADNTVDDVLITFEESTKKTIDPLALRFNISELPKPRFAYSVQVVDTETGNGDGLLQKGESVKVLVDIENTGAGKASTVFATLKSLSGKNVFLSKGREKLEEIDIGKQKQAVFEFKVKPDFQDTRARFELAVMDVDLKVYAVEKLSIDIETAAPWQTLTPEPLVFTQDSEVLVSPTTKAKSIATASRGCQAEADGVSADGKYYRISIGGTRPGWIEKSAVAKSVTRDVATTPKLIINAPPTLTIEPVDSVVRRGVVTISGSASDESQVRDVYIYVGDDKIFFKPNTDPSRLEAMEFETEVELKHGMNFITVVAEETSKLDTRSVIAIRRDSDNGMPYMRRRDLSGEHEPVNVIPVPSP